MYCNPTSGFMNHAARPLDMQGTIW